MRRRMGAGDENPDVTGEENRDVAVDENGCAGGEYDDVPSMRTYL